MDQSKKGCFALFLGKHAACNGCFILMHCHCQIMCVHVALRKSIHFREISEWAYTDDVTTFVNMQLYCWQALIFWPINFYYFRVWCLLSLCHLKRKLFKSTIMPVEVLISIAKDWYKLVLQNCQDRWKWGLHGIFLSFLDVFGLLIPNLDDAKSYLLSILRFGWKKSIFGKKSFFFYIFNKVEAGFLFVIGWSWFYRSFCIKIKNIAYDRSVFNDKSVILRTFVIKVRCAIYLYFLVFANIYIFY